LFLKRIEPSEPITPENTETPVQDKDDVLAREAIAETKDAEYEKGVKIANLLHDQLTKADVPITFYGKVVDQNKDPVEGVVIEGKATYYNGVKSLDYMQKGKNPYEYTPFSVVTDSDGRFVIEGIKGRSMRFILKKENYQSNQNRFNYTYDPLEKNLKHEPNIDKPVVFTMWKSVNVKLEGLIKERRVRIRVKRDQYSYVKMLPRPVQATDKEFDFKVKISSKDLGEKSEEWTLLLESNTGFFAITDDDFLYEAPEAGYQNKIELPISPNRRMPTQRYKFKLYYKDGDGIFYASLDCTITKSSDGDSIFYFNAVVNPNSSRILQLK